MLGCLPEGFDMKSKFDGVQHMAEREGRGRTGRASASASSSAPPELNGTLPPAPETPLSVRERGWLLPTLLRTDTLLHGRWDYLTDCWEQGELPSAPIPRLSFLSLSDKATWKMLTASLDAIPNHGHGGWAGWSGSDYFRYFLEWTLHGLGHKGQPETPKEPGGCEGASERLARVFDLPLLQQNPYDYFGDLLAQNAYGKRQGFFPTPHTLAEFMTQMTLGGSDADTRALTVCDPCVGTGRLLLHASNYSLRLYGMDIDETLCLATLVNGYLYAPWLVRPLPYLDEAQYQPQHSEALSDAMAAQAQPHQAERLAGTEHDAEQQWRFEPVKKRRVKDGPEEGEAQQGILT